MITSLSVVLAISVLYFVLPGGISAQQEEKTFVTHSGGIIKTTGEVLDPLYTSTTVEFDPMEYLRDFDYGRISQLPDGTTLREYTIIAEDDKVMEVSPGVFYNVWTFNGTVPGPTIRATEGDLVRIKFINNGSKEHTMHFHGIHEAQFDGVFEPVGPGGGQFTYEWRAGPVGVHPYHCHIMPLEEHIVHGL
ncbi:MAG: multicopper oxidase domain-containing protein, partial [Nitrososphaeraceae archaeon]|nr:multicopper oxidase domain-containing protein [Nitrososphaeraceae archaeon]